MQHPNTHPEPAQQTAVWPGSGFVFTYIIGQIRRDYWPALAYVFLNLAGAILPMYVKSTWTYQVGSRSLDLPTYTLPIWLASMWLVLAYSQTLAAKQTLTLEYMRQLGSQWYIRTLLTTIVSIVVASLPFAFWFLFPGLAGVTSLAVIGGFIYIALLVTFFGLAVFCAADKNTEGINPFAQFNRAKRITIGKRWLIWSPIIVAIGVVIVLSLISNAIDSLVPGNFETAGNIFDALTDVVLFGMLTYLAHYLQKANK